jgi:3-isopropylmalate dehydrogenase
MTYRLGVIEGDGIGPEVISAAMTVTAAALAQHPSVRVDFTELLAGSAAIEALGSPMPDETIEELSRSDGWILGPHDSASYPVEHRQGSTFSGQLRSHFELYANYRPVRTLPGLGRGVAGVDLCVVRENTEGFYADRNMAVGKGEFMPTLDVALVVGVFTRKAIERVVTAAFELAQTRRRHLTLVHKANVIPLAFGLYTSIFEDIATRFPAVTTDAWHVDAFAAEMIRTPQAFDVVVAENMFGDILSEIAAELAGGLGMAPSLNAGERHAMAQATHGSAPDIAGRNIANPVGEMLSVALLFEWLGRRHDDKDIAAVGADIRAAVELTVGRGVGTPDIGGALSTSEFAAQVAAACSEPGSPETAVTSRRNGPGPLWSIS